MKIIVAPDSFKGSLTALRICELVQDAAATVCPQAEVIALPLADGGEGTADAVLHALHGTRRTCSVHGPLGNPVTCEYGIFDGLKINSAPPTSPTPPLTSLSPASTGNPNFPVNQRNQESEGFQASGVSEMSASIPEQPYNQATRIAVMDMAAASGLTLVDDAERDVLHSSTYGTGEMILDALNQGCEQIYIGLGGSATNDGGMGMAAALGVRFLDENGQELAPAPVSMAKIVSVDASGMDARMQQVPITIMSDVRNPLLGKTGATYVYGPQKGVTQEQLPIIDSWMEHYMDCVEQCISREIRTIPGAGAAGGLGAGLLAYGRATMKSGIETILELTDFDALLRDADFVITGEGRMDYQSAYGKVVSGVGMHCQAQGVPCYALVGSIGDGAEALYDYGITSILPTVNGIMTLEEAISNAEPLCYDAAVRLLRFLCPQHS